MKKYLFSLIILLLGWVHSNAQTEVIKNFYDKYTKKENVEDITLKGWLLKIASEINGDDQVSDVLDKITQLRILIMEDGNLVSPKAYKQFVNDIQEQDFEELIQLKEGGELVECYIREEGDDITNILLMVHEKDGFILLSLEGLLQLKDLKNININVDGGEYIKKIPSEKHRA